MLIKIMSYRECREDFFVNLIKHAENKIKYWERQKGYRCEIEIDNNLSEAGAEISYCQDALKALEKQTPKKPENYAIDNNGYMIYDCECPNCHKSHRECYPFAYCNHCGQALDWSDTE